MFIEAQIQFTMRNMGVSSALGPDGFTGREMRKIPTAICMVIFKNFLSFRCLPGGLGVLELSPVAAECQVKAFARLQRLGSPVVDAVLERALRRDREALEARISVPTGIVEPSLLKKALQEARTTHLEDWKKKYTNKSLFAFENDPARNGWLRPDARYMGDGDRIPFLRLRTYLFPVRTLSNRHSRDDSAKLCRRCHQARETTHHTLQVCQSVDEPRCLWHNFISQAIITKLRERHKDAEISSERLLVTGDGTRLRPDIVLEHKENAFILDVAITWDARTETLEGMCAAKRQKYQAFAPVLQAKCHGRDVKGLGLAFGARSLLCPSTKKAAKEIGLKEWELAWLVARTLDGSLIWPSGSSGGNSFVGPVLITCHTQRFDFHRLKWFDDGIPPLRVEDAMIEPKGRNDPIRLSYCSDQNCKESSVSSITSFSGNNWSSLELIFYNKSRMSSGQNRHLHPVAALEFSVAGKSYIAKPDGTPHT
ncbi:hypothetical protein HPB49_022212 [Dermacentor silvarum]|uniref:Uncharacterized protein n=1 Tax=Dermacentor silvarum TaxID=543639 RepID=A0ACB8C5R7_DERSI|nr:hypothetical protein HPB49_022212 [Dermacentor silvarum]